jgi:hypothetical protein
MEEANNEKREKIIEKIRRKKDITIEKAKELLATLETYCELIINYTLKK